MFCILWVLHNISIPLGEIESFCEGRFSCTGYEGQSEDDYEEDVFVEGGLCFLFCKDVMRPCAIVFLKTWISAIPIFV